MNINSFGRGVWADRWFIVEKCPICGEEWTFRFLAASGFWTCVSCGKAGTELVQLQDHVDFEIGSVDEPEGLIAVGRYQEKPKADMLPTGFSSLDNMLGGWAEGAMTLLTGKRGEGKSTMAELMAMYQVQFGTPVCYYSGELTVDTFLAWFYQMAAGVDWVEPYTDKHGAPRFRPKARAKDRIRRWVGDRLVLYDNSVVKASERNAILARFEAAHAFYGCQFFVVDNLMTARYTDSERDYYRQQGNFAGELTEFALRSKSHVVLVAHPKKVEAGGGAIDDNDMVAGSAELTNRATNVIRIEKPTDKVKEALAKKGKDGCDSIMKVTKNREYGTTGDILFDYDPSTRRLIQQGGSQVTRLGWEDM